MILHPERHQAMVVDPGDAQPVIDTLSKKDIILTGILITHHHWDHTNGVNDLTKNNDIPVYGPGTINTVTHPVKEGDQIHLAPLDCDFTVLEIPGHTLDHIAYFGNGMVFCGDMLFTAGCGRVFEGTFPQMYESLQKLAQLPPETNIYCGHEYTQANLRFAEAVEPENSDIQKRIVETNALRSNGQPTVPAPLSLELKTNPFLRCEKKSVHSAATAHSGKKVVDAVETFTEIRSWKDNF